MSLADEIANWDRRSARSIRDIYDRHHRDGLFIYNVTKMMRLEPLQNGTTWLLKHHLSNSKNSLSKAEISAVYNNVQILKDWQSRLHILQIMARMPVPQTRLKEVEQFVRSCITNEAKFVRAWAYDGFYQLALQYPHYRQEALSLFAKAIEEDAAGSVKARLRDILKRGFPSAAD